MDGTRGIRCNKKFRIREFGQSQFRSHMQQHDKKQQRLVRGRRSRSSSEEVYGPRYRSNLLSLLPQDHGYTSALDPTTTGFFNMGGNLPNNMSVADSIKLVFDCAMSTQKTIQDMFKDIPELRVRTKLAQDRAKVMEDRVKESLIQLKSRSARSAVELDRNIVAIPDI